MFGDAGQGLFYHLLDLWLIKSFCLVLQLGAVGVRLGISSMFWGCLVMVFGNEEILIPLFKCNVARVNTMTLLIVVICLE